MSVPARWGERTSGGAARGGVGVTDGEGIRLDGTGTHFPATAGGRPLVDGPEQDRSVGSSGGVRSWSWSHSQGPSGFIGQKPFGWVHSWCVEACWTWWTTDRSGSACRPTTRASRSESTCAPRDRNRVRKRAVTVPSALREDLGTISPADGTSYNSDDQSFRMPFGPPGSFARV